MKGWLRCSKWLWCIFVDQWYLFCCVFRSRRRHGRFFSQWRVLQSNDRKLASNCYFAWCTLRNFIRVGVNRESHLHAIQLLSWDATCLMSPRWLLAPRYWRDFALTMASEFFSELVATALHSWSMVQRRRFMACIDSYVNYITPHCVSKLVTGTWDPWVAQQSQ